MPTFTATRPIAAPASLVWSRLARVVAWPEWLPTVSRVEASSSAALEVGAKYKVIQPRLKPAVWTVTEFHPGRHFVWESSSPGLKLWANHMVEDVPTGGSRITLEFRFSGLLSPLVTLLAGNITRRYLATEAESLGRHAEADAACARPGSA